MPLDCGAHRMQDNGERYYKAKCPDCEALNENVNYSRALIVIVYVDRVWLTTSFEYDEEGGWKELESQLREQLTKVNIPDVRVVYDGWQDDPVVEA